MTIPVATGQLDIKELEPSDLQGRLLLPKDQFGVLSIPDFVDNSLKCRCSIICLDNVVVCEVSLTLGPALE